MEIKKIKENQINIYLSGRIDSNNAKDVEIEILQSIGTSPETGIVIDAGKLEYISSAGLRVFLRLKKTYPSIKIINVSSDLYEIFNMTGFTQIMDVEKAYRVVSVEGCEEIGRGANGRVYRIDQDNVVKVYENTEALSEIRHEREVARKALVLGIPTAISYDVVRVGNSYGSVFELLNAKSFAQILASDSGKIEWCAKEGAELLRKIHRTVVPKGELPDIRESALSWVKDIKDNLPKDAAEKLNLLIKEVPEDFHMLHGDFHVKNIEYVDGEVLIIDMDTLSVGHPIFEIAAIYSAHLGYSELAPDSVEEFLGISYEVAKKYLEKFWEYYLKTSDTEKINAILDKARVLSYVRIFRKKMRGLDLASEEKKSEAEYYKKQLLDFLEKTDTLLFETDEKGDGINEN